MNTDYCDLVKSETVQVQAEGFFIIPPHNQIRCCVIQALQTPNPKTSNPSIVVNQDRLGGLFS